MWKIWSFVMLLIWTGSGIGYAQPKEQKVIELSMTSTFPQSSIHSQAMIAWGKELEKRTKGRAKIGQATWSGALLKQSSLMPGLGKGVADVAFIASSYSRSLFPIISAVSPVFIDDGYHSAGFTKELYETTPEIQEEYRRNNIRPLYFVRSPDQILGTTFKFSNLEGFKNKRLRSLGEVHDWCAKLGAIPINIASGDIYVAVQKGTIDGYTGMMANALFTHKLAEVVVQVTDTRFGCYAAWNGVGMNLDVYNRLPADIKKIIEEIGPVATDYYAKADDEESFKGLELCKRQGVAIVQLSPEESARWYKIVDPPSIWEKYIKEAEAAGYPARRIMERALIIWEKYKKQTPHKALFDRFWEKK